mgnify:CR=1 FL=1
MAEKTKEQEKRQAQKKWQNREMYLERISKLRLMDDDFFSEALDGKIEEKGNALFADGLHILYVNGEYQDVDTPIGRLMHDFYCTRSEDMYSKILADEVKYLKETEGGRDRMCKVLEEMCEEVAKEKAKETARLLLTLNKLSHEEISESTGLPLDVVEEMAAQKTA